MLSGNFVEILFFKRWFFGFCRNMCEVWNNWNYYWEIIFCDFLFKELDNWDEKEKKFKFLNLMSCIYNDCIMIFLLIDLCLFGEEKFGF